MAAGKKKQRDAPTPSDAAETTLERFQAALPPRTMTGRRW
jgi:hypothetical protein